MLSLSSSSDLSPNLGFSEQLQQHHQYNSFDSFDANPEFTCLGGLNNLSTSSEEENTAMQIC